MTQNLILVRGLPGSGKSSFGALLGPCFAADDYFMVDGVYRFNPSGLTAAHSMCQDLTRESLRAGNPVTVVANTFSCRWEMDAYVLMARARPAVRFVVVDLFDGGLTDEELFERNVHGVPLHSIQGMRERWEHDWKVGNPIPPWQRQITPNE